MNKNNEGCAVRLGLVHIFYLGLAIIFGFTTVFDSMNLTSLTGGPKQKSASGSFFINSFISTYKPDANNFNVFSQKLVDRINEKKVYFNAPKGSFGSDQKVSFEGDQGILTKDKGNLVVSDNVILTSDGMKTTSRDLSVNLQKNSAIATGNVKSDIDEGVRKVSIRAQKLFVEDAKKELRYLGVVNGEIKGRDKQAFSNISFKSDLLTYNNVDKIIFLEGNAFINRAKSQISGLRGNIWLNNQTSRVKYFSMSDDVKLRDEFVNAQGKVIKRNSFSEKVEGFSDEEKLILSGFPQVEQEGDIIKGNQMIIREDQEMIEIINTNSQFRLKNRND